MKPSDKECRDLINRYLRRPDIYGMRETIAYYEERIRKTEKPQSIDSSAEQEDPKPIPPQMKVATMVCQFCNETVFPAMVSPQVGKPQMFELKTGDRHACPGWLKRKEEYLKEKGKL